VPGGVFTDSEDNPYLYYILAVISAAGIFILSRTKWGCIVLFAAGSFVLCMIRFLYEINHLAEMVIFILCAGVLYIYRNYRVNTVKASTIKPAFWRTALTGSIVCLLAICVGSGIFYGIIGPMDPSARELKLITRYLALPTLEKIGVAERTEIPDDKLTSDKLNSDEQSGMEGLLESLKLPQGADKPNEEEKNDKTTPAFLDSSTNPFFFVINYLVKTFGWFLLPIIAAIAIATSILVKLYRRKRWIAKLLDKPATERIMTMYRFYLKKFHYLKIDKSEADTLFEFVRRATPTLGQFGVAGVGFGDLTDIYVKSCYGSEPVSGEEVESYREFHGSFYKNCRAYLGGFMYMVRFFGL
jgi:hypothetical protein